MDKQYLQNESHDQLGESAESYIRYVFAREGFEVYGDSKWGADCAVLDSDTGRWYRIEIRSTDRLTGWPVKKQARRLKGKAELVTEVIFRGGQITVYLRRVHRDGTYNRKSGCTICATTRGGLQRFTVDGNSLRDYLRGLTKMPK